MDPKKKVSNYMCSFAEVNDHMHEGYYTVTLNFHNKCQGNAENKREEICL